MHSSSPPAHHPALVLPLVPTSSSCLHNNLQLFSSYFRTPSIDAAVPIQPRAGFARPRRAPDTTPVRARASPDDQTTEHSRRSRHTCGHFFVNHPSHCGVRARTTTAQSRSPSSREAGKRGKGRGSATVTLRKLSEQSLPHTAGRPSLLSNSAAPPARQSVFVLHPAGGA